MVGPLGLWEQSGVPGHEGGGDEFAHGLFVLGDVPVWGQEIAQHLRHLDLPRRVADDFLFKTVFTDAPDQTAGGVRWPPDESPLFFCLRFWSRDSFFLAIFEAIDSNGPQRDHIHIQSLPRQLEPVVSGQVHKIGETNAEGKKRRALNNGL